MSGWEAAGCELRVAGCGLRGDGEWVGYRTWLINGSSDAATASLLLLVAAPGGLLARHSIVSDARGGDHPELCRDPFIRMIVLGKWPQSLSEKGADTLLERTRRHHKTQKNRLSRCQLDIHKGAAPFSDRLSCSAVVAVGCVGQARQRPLRTCKTISYRKGCQVAGRIW